MLLLKQGKRNEMLKWLVWKERWGGGSLCDIFKTSCIIICTWAAYAFKITVYFWNISAPLLPFHMNRTWAIIAGALAELWPLALMIIDALKHRNKPKLNQNRIRALNFDKLTLSKCECFFQSWVTYRPQLHIVKVDLWQQPSWSVLLEWKLLS